MTLGSFVHGALADMSPGDLDRMLELDESLFVEHKGDLGDESNYGLAKAISAFANTLGGWLLLGVTNGKPHGSTATWTSRGQGPTPRGFDPRPPSRRGRPPSSGWSITLASNAVRLRGSGHALVDAGWQKSRLVPASHTLTEDQQLALQQIAPRQRGLSVTAARVLRTFIAGSLDAAWHQHASGADRAALAELLKQGVLRIVDDGNRSTLVLSDACAYLDPGVPRPNVLDPRPYVDGSMRR